MEFTLHKQLKQMYCGLQGETEVRLGRFRIDAVVEETLYEVQLGSLSAIRDKVRKLTRQHQVVVVKPLVSRKRLVKLNRKKGKPIDERWSPKRQAVLDLFDELVYFTQAFPHPNLQLHVPLVSVLETRYPGRGKRRRKSAGEFQIEDRMLVEVEQTYEFHSLADLLNLLPTNLPEVFDTKMLAKALQVDRRFAQRIAYTLRKMQAFREVGKQRNAILYSIAAREAQSLKVA